MTTFTTTTKTPYCVTATTINTASIEAVISALIKSNEGIILANKSVVLKEFDSKELFSILTIIHNHIVDEADGEGVESFPIESYSIGFKVGPKGHYFIIWLNPKSDTTSLMIGPERAYFGRGLK